MLNSPSIGVGGYRILGGGGGGGGGGQGLEYWGGGARGGPNSQQAHDITLTSHRRHFDLMYCAHLILINQC